MTTIRTLKKTVVFSRPFTLPRWDEALPAGDYCVETDEELIEDISFPAYRRVLTLLHIPAAPDRPGHTRVAAIDPRDLEEALRQDTAPAAGR